MSRAISVIVVSIVLLSACGDANDPRHDPAATATLEITALAGPVCPVKTDPPSPDCAPRPVDMAIIAVSGPGGRLNRHSQPKNESVRLPRSMRVAEDL